MPPTKPKQSNAKDYIKRGFMPPASRAVRLQFFALAPQITSSLPQPHEQFQVPSIDLCSLSHQTPHPAFDCNTSLRHTHTHQRPHMHTNGIAAQSQAILHPHSFHGSNSTNVFNTVTDVVTLANLRHPSHTSAMESSCSSTLSLALLKASEAMQVDQRVAMWAPCQWRNHVPEMH